MPTRIRVARRAVESMFAIWIFPTPSYGVIYYVNDVSTVGDVYCSVGGSDVNTGLEPGKSGR